MQKYSDVGGKYIDVSNGRLFYRWHGPENGPVLLLVHGLTTPSFVWRDMLPALIAADYRILTFDHFGRGFSSNPNQPQNFEFYNREIIDLLDALKIDGPIHLLGYSMGGGVVASFAANYPNRVNHLIMLAPCGFRTALGGFFEQVAKTPLLGDLLMQLFAGRIFRAGALQSAKSEGVDAGMIAMQCAETRKRGFAKAVLSSIRHVTNKTLDAEHNIITKNGTPALAIFANDDAVIPISGANGLSAANPSATIITIHDAGHGLAYTHAPQVTKAVVGFLPSA